MNTQDFEMIDLDGSKYQISVDYEADGDITAIVIKGDVKDLLSYQAENRIYAAFHGSFEK